MPNRSEVKHRRALGTLMHAFKELKIDAAPGGGLMMLRLEARRELIGWVYELSDRYQVIVVPSVAGPKIDMSLRTQSDAHRIRRALRAELKSRALARRILPRSLKLAARVLRPVWFAINFTPTPSLLRKYR